MGSGKSTLGKKLAALLKCNFIDLDDYIELHEHSSISHLFEQEGEAAFRRKEADYLRTLLNTDKKSVISLGGGTVCFEDNLPFVKQHGLLVYLELPATVLADRIRNSRRERPLLKGLAGHDLTNAISQRLEQRLPFYAQAHLTVNGLNLTPQLLHHAVVEAQKK